METTTFSKFNKFGKVGKTVMNVLIVISILLAIASCVATIFVATQPKDALTVRVTNNTEFKINEKNFDSIWSILVKNFSYAGNTIPENSTIPPENQEFKTELKFFNQSYSSAKIHSDGNTKIVEAQSSSNEYSSSDLVVCLIFITLSVILIVLALFMLKKLFVEFENCKSPFCEKIVKKMKAFALSLLPVALFTTIAETFGKDFLSAGRNSSISIQWGILIAFAITMCLVTVFKYGVQLQKELDETL